MKTLECSHSDTPQPIKPHSSTPEMMHAHGRPGVGLGGRGAPTGCAGFGAGHGRSRHGHDRRWDCAISSVGCWDVSVRVHEAMPSTATHPAITVAAIADVIDPAVDVAEGAEHREQSPRSAGRSRSTISRNSGPGGVVEARIIGARPPAKNSTTIGHTECGAGARRASRRPIANPAITSERRDDQRRTACPSR